MFVISWPSKLNDGRKFFVGYEEDTGMGSTRRSPYRNMDKVEKFSSRKAAEDVLVKFEEQGYIVQDFEILEI